jgi:mono/diheme cytochrome c family protein
MKTNSRVALPLVAALALAGLVGCSKQEAPKTEAPPPAPAAAPAPSTPAQADVAGPKALFEQKCSVCHTVDRATSRQETKESWAALVKKMQAKQPGAISDEEAAKIVDFLAAEHGKK